MEDTDTEEVLNEAVAVARFKLVGAAAIVTAVAVAVAVATVV